MEDGKNISPMKFEDLEAWKQARELTALIYRLCRREPLCRDFGLCDQLRRASVSIMNNTAEGWESLHPAEKVQFYNVARRSCGEVRSMSYVLLDNQYMGTDEQREIHDRSVRCGKLITGLLHSAERRK
jgi:four helix bundle protein